MCEQCGAQYNMDRDRRGLYYYYDRKVTTSESVSVDIERQQGGHGGDTFEYSNLKSAGYISSHASAAAITPHGHCSSSSSSHTTSISSSSSNGNKQ